MTKQPSPPRTVIGWREYIALPHFDVDHIKAKADTGARTSAIDVDNIQQLPDGRVRFDLIVDRNHPGLRVTAEADVVRWAKVKSSFGQAHTRPIIKARIRLGAVEKDVQFGLVCRRNMLCRVLLGRAALSPEFVVDPEHRYLHGRKPPRKQPSTRNRKKQ